MLGIAFLQGVCLFALYRAVETNSWPSESPLWSFPLWTLVLSLPLLLLLSIDRHNYAAVLNLASGFVAVLVLLGIYTGWQAEPHGAFRIESLAIAFAASIALACFKALMYLQQRANGVPLTYQVLFTNSWRNFLVGVLSALFTLMFWLILMLWAQLFRVIEIDFFHELFTEDWFVIPTLSVAFGLGVSLFRGLTRVIDNITKLLHWLIMLLLPLVLVVAIVFLAALPFVGLDVLWSTGRGTALLLWLLAVLLFFTNAVYQDGREENPYPLSIHRLIYIGLCVMPIIAALSLYGLVLRLNQYGWTVNRSWAFVVWLVLTLFALGYVAGIVRQRDKWTAELARVNTAMGLVVLTIMLLANSPLLDVRKISLASQLARVESGEIELHDFDFWYAKNHLARPGHLALEKMKQDVGDSDPELLAMINTPIRRRPAVSLENAEAMWAKLIYRPERFDIPDGLKPLLANRFGVMVDVEPVILRADLDEDGEFEYILMLLRENGAVSSAFYYRTDAGWQQGQLQHVWAYRGDDLRERIINGEIELVKPRFKSLQVGGITLRALPIE
jgi:hypothetical protein